MDLELIHYFFAWLDKLKIAHPVAWLIMVWIVAAPVLNLLIAFGTSKRWDEITAKYPRLAALLKLLKVAGIDPVGILKQLYVVLTGKKWAPPEEPPKSDA